MRNRILKTGAGFTLIELLLVISLTCIVLAIAMPSFVQSIRGHRLRTAARTMATVARYARSMAVLKQSDLSVTFNLDNGHIDMISSNTTLPRFSRVIKGVTLGYVDIEGDESPYTEGTCIVMYSQNGICNPFTVKILDRNGNYIIMKVDALSSIKMIEYGNL